MERTDDITINAPLGIRFGTMTFNCHGTEVTGTLNAFGNHDDFTGQIGSNGEIEIKGKITSLINSVPYYAKGIINDCSLNLQLITNKYSFAITGIAQKKGV